MTGTRELFGVLNLNKPAGLTSRDVVDVVQRLVRPARAGHAGTLDPLATGVLLVCVGQATRLISLLQQTSKVYATTFLLGQRSDTDDSTGQVTVSDTAQSIPTEAEVRTALQAFTGLIDQVPPAYSAVHVQGRRAYEMARKGEMPELSARQVFVEELQLLDYEWPRLRLQITCGSGTYIRSIARDLGENLGCGGLMSELQRVRIGSFSLDDAVAPEQLTAENLDQYLIPAIRIVDGIASYRCTEDEQRRVANGGSLELDKARLTRSSRKSAPGRQDAAELPPVALLSESGQELLGVGEIRRQGRKIQPRTVFATATSQQPDTSS